MIISALHRSSRTTLEIRRTPAGLWAIESYWWGFDLKGEDEEYSATVAEYPTEQAARAALAQLQEVPA